MNENLDLTKILKDCPEGTKFYSSYLGKDVFFIRIHNNDIECKYPPKIDSPFDCMIEFRKNGSLCKDGECMLFPSKDQRDWSKWHRPFKNGDVVTYKLKGSLVAFIYKERTTTTLVKSHFALYIQNMGFCIDGDIALKEEDIVFATEEEKQKLFNVIKLNGFKWNAETKTLEKLIVPKFKVGDIIRKKNDTKECVITKIYGDLYDYVTSKTYKSPCFIKRERGYFPIDSQDDYELIPDKFKPDFFEPFDKVLCRMNNDDIWGISLFERHAPTNPYPFFCIQDCFSQCVPYNDNTKHLVGTNNEAPEYYKCWED